MNMKGLDAVSRDDIVDFGPRVPVSEIIEVCAAIWTISPELLLSPRRSGAASDPRHAGMYLAAMLRGDLSLPVIARLFRRSDHTTVLYAIRKVEARRKRDTAYARKLAAAQALLTIRPTVTAVYQG